MATALRYPPGVTAEGDDGVTGSLFPSASAMRRPTKLNFLRRLSTGFSIKCQEKTAMAVTRSIAPKKFVVKFLPLIVLAYIACWTGYPYKYTP